jgi:DNA-binding SARP family transcriptional activator/tetratricopeptide (TPR) repeat protein
LTIRLRTFGGLSLENAASIGGGTANRRPLALLALLAVKGRRGLSRDSVVALFWPESDSEHGRNSLSQAISVLRRALAADDVVLGTTELRVNPDIVACDAVEFENRIAADDLEAATKLYAGPFLDGVFLRNTPEFEHWMDRERARFQHLQCDALERLATRADASGDHASSVRLCRQRTTLAPNDSRAALALMKSMVASGDSAGSLAHYRAHREHLRAEMGLDPEAALTEFAATVRAGSRRTMHGHGDASTGGATSVDNGDVAALRAPTAAGAARPEISRVDGPHAAATRSPRRTPVLVLIAAVAVFMVAAAAWVTKVDRFDLAPPKPPAHDSLRLRVVTASVQSDPADSTLAQRVRNAALAEMALDPWLFVVTPAAWVLLAPSTGLDEGVFARPDTVRKYARKARTHAIVDFGVSRAGSGYVLTAEARSAGTDSSLGVIAEAAASALDMPGAMTRLGRNLRERVVAARATLPPTRWSLPTTDQPAQAIELYVEGRSEFDRRNFIEAARRAEAAVRVDSTFALAWRQRHGALSNAQLSIDDQLNAISAAFRFSNRVRSPVWRFDIVTAYYRAIGDHERALVFYDSLARLSRVDNLNAGLSYAAVRRYDRATRGYRRYVDSRRSLITDARNNLVRSLLDEGNVAEARREVADMVRIDSTHPHTIRSQGLFFTAVRDWESLGAIGRASINSARTPMDSVAGLRWVRDAEIARGRFAAFDSIGRSISTIIKKHGSSGDVLANALRHALLRAAVAGDSVMARVIADSGLADTRWETLKPMDRPYVAMLMYLASVRDVKRGDALVRDWSRHTPTEFKLRDSLNMLVGRSELVLASGNARAALRLLRLADVRDCQPCFYPRFGRVFDALHEPDSARVWYERYASASNPLGASGDAVELAHTYVRLGELYEERGDVTAALEWYGRFTTLWATSDPPALQARVRDVRSRMESLTKPGRPHSP